MSEEDSEVQAARLWCSKRLCLAFLLFLGFVNQYAIRVNMSVAIVCMTRQPATADPCHNDTSVTDNIEKCQQNITDDNLFDWDTKTQGLILSSFLWGYISTQIAFGWLAGRFGGKQLFGWCAFGCGVATMLIPIATKYNIGFLIGLRVIAGIFQGASFPATAVILANWAPPLERSTLGGIAFAGCPIGNVVSFPISGLLCTYGFAGGWPSIFYFFGTLCVLWSVVWLLVVHDSPVLHPRISLEEKAYIVNRLKSDIDITKKSTTTPWKMLFTSLPVWAIFVANTCADWGIWTFMTNITTFMDDVLDIQVEKIGFLSALPYIGYWVMVNVSGLLADFLRSRQYATTTTIRKLFQSLGYTMAGRKYVTCFEETEPPRNRSCIFYQPWCMQLACRMSLIELTGNIVPAVFVLMAGYAENIYAVVSFLTIGIAMVGCQHGGGFLVNPMDIAPRYAGLILGFSNTFGTLGGILIPLYIGILTKDSTREQWQYVFIITAIIFTLGALFFIIFSSGVIQPWALEEDEKTDIQIATISIQEKATVHTEEQNSSESTN